VPHEGHALELGCGTDLQTPLLAEHGLDVLGVDISEVAIDQARKRAAASGPNGHARFLSVDVTALRDSANRSMCSWIAAVTT
jgi:ubiquinone/menaquinone biosynthesis C-methylase UbiE